MFFLIIFSFFFFNDTATTEIYTLSLHDALPIAPMIPSGTLRCGFRTSPASWSDRKSTRLNSSHEWISYAVFCLKKKKIGSLLFYFVNSSEGGGYKKRGNFRQ